MRAAGEPIAPAHLLAPPMASPKSSIALAVRTRAESSATVHVSTFARRRIFREAPGYGVTTRCPFLALAL